jgi:hypothetical protein
MCCPTAANHYVALQQGYFSRPFKGVTAMEVIALENVRSIRQPREAGVRRPSIIETILQVLAEAIESASAARCRYPLAD